MFARRLLAIQLVFLFIGHFSVAQKKAGEAKEDLLLIANTKVESFLRKKDFSPLKLKDLTKELKEARGRYKRQANHVEIDLDVLVSAIGEIPVKDFKKSDCKAYRMKMISDYEPTADFVPQGEGLKLAIRVLERVCK